MRSVNSDIWLKTARLDIRPLTLDDLDQHQALTNDETLARNASRLPFPYTMDDARAFLTMKINAWTDGEEFAFGGFAGATLIGHASLRLLPEGWSLGYDTHRDHRGAGYATELARAVCQFGFDRLETPEIRAGHYVDNPASGVVLRKLGFQATGERVSVFSKGRDCKVESIEYVLRRDDFQPTANPTDIDPRAQGAE